MKRLVYGGLLMAAGMAAAGCGGRAGHTLSVPIDSDTIVLADPDMPQELAIDSDSIGEVPPLPPDSLIRPEGQRGDRPSGQPPREKEDNMPPPGPHSL